jgi:hypothetical protein
MVEGNLNFLSCRPSRPGSLEISRSGLVFLFFAQPVPPIAPRSHTNASLECDNLPGAASLQQGGLEQWHAQRRWHGAGLHATHGRRCSDCTIRVIHTIRVIPDNELGLAHHRQPLIHLVSHGRPYHVFDTSSTTIHEHIEMLVFA